MKSKNQINLNSLFMILKNKIQIQIKFSTIFYSLKKDYNPFLFKNKLSLFRIKRETGKNSIFLQESIIIQNNKLVNLGICFPKKLNCLFYLISLKLMTKVLSKFKIIIDKLLQILKKTLEFRISKIQFLQKKSKSLKI